MRREKKAAEKQLNAYRRWTIRSCLPNYKGYSEGVREGMNGQEMIHTSLSRAVFYLDLATTLA